PPPSGPSKGPGPSGLRITPVDLVIEDLKPKSKIPQNTSFQGMISVGPGLDVLWSKSALYVMKEKGKLIQVWRADGPSNGFFDSAYVMFDGKYVWATFPPIQSKNNFSLVVLEPRTAKVWDLTDSEGLPHPPEKIPEGTRFSHIVLMASPLGPG